MDREHLRHPQRPAGPGTPPRPHPTRGGGPSRPAAPRPGHRDLVELGDRRGRQALASRLRPLTTSPPNRKQSSSAHEHHEPASTCWSGLVEVPQKEQGGPLRVSPAGTPSGEDTASYPCRETIHGIRIRTERCGCPGMAQRVESGKVSAAPAGRSTAALPTSKGPTGRP